jgi:hypothetical protein
MKSPGISMEQAFEVIRLVQQKDDGYYYCHVASHIIVANEVDKNPANWKDVFVRCPEEMCSNGCLHGAFQERFKADKLTDAELQSLIPELKTLCEPRPSWHPTEDIHTSCYHGIGHALMYMTAANVAKSIEVCGQVGSRPSGKGYLQTCVEGIFMQIYQPREPEDFALVKDVAPKKEDIPTFCSQFSFNKTAAAACHRESWVMFEDQIKTPQGLISFCSYTQDPNEHWQCLNKMFFSLMAINNLDVNTALGFCPSLPEEYRSQCFADTATRIITADRTLIQKSLSICSFADSSGIGSECYNRLVEYAALLYQPGTSGFNDYCQGFPNSWKGKCLGQNAS